MKARLVTLTLTLSALIVVSAAVSTQAATQGNSNKARPPKRAKANANAPAAAPAAQAKPAASAEKPVAAKPAKKKKKKPAAAAAGIPSGAENCIKRLQELAEKDPLPDYEGQPSKIVNEGLLWNDPKAKCSVSDEAKRNKIVDMATYWRLKDAAKVRSLLSELGSM